MVGSTGLEALILLGHMGSPGWGNWSMPWLELVLSGRQLFIPLMLDASSLTQLARMHGLLAFVPRLPLSLMAVRRDRRSVLGSGYP